MGAAGDMLTAALLELLPDRNSFIDRMNSLGLRGVRISCEPSIKCGITGTRVIVTVNGEEEKCLTGEGEHHHISMTDISSRVEYLNVSDTVKSNITSIYHLIAEAESRVHGRPVDQIHFHEVGTMDALADITGVCLLMEMLAPDHIFASPVCTGFGEVRCAHGLLPVPAPAAAYLLRGIPVYGGNVCGELCTPTGGALLKFFVDKFGSMPLMKTDAIGCGMGKNDFEAANCLRAYWGTTESASSEISELACNIDDMTPEAVGFAQEVLFTNGALDVFTTPVGMKKSRPGVLLTCICKKEQAGEMADLILKHTTTIGIREYGCRRHTLVRTERTIQTEFGPVRIKTSTGAGTVKSKPEYEDIVQIARKNGMTFAKTSELVMRVFETGNMR